MKKCLGCFVVCMALWVPGLSQAEDAQKDTEIVSTMEEVVVTATKTAEQRKDIPNSVIIKDAIDIEESPAKTLGELLANEPGIDWRTYGDYGGSSGEIHIRGMSGNSTAIFLNGLNINSPSLGTSDVAKIPLNSIEKIEVVKGSGSLLYGSGAMGGTINIITKQPEKDKIDLRAKAGYGENDTYELSLENGMFLSKDFGYYLTASKRETDGFRNNSDLDHKDVSLKLVFDKGDLLNVSLYGDYIDREYGLPGVEPPKGTADFYVNGIKVYDNHASTLLDNGSDEDAHIVLEAKSQPLDWLGLRIRGDYTNMENYGYFRYLDFSGNLVGNKTWVTNEVSGVEGNININPFTGANLLLGMEYKNFDWENKSVDLNNNGAELPASKTKTDEDLHTTGSYAEAQYRPSKYIKGVLGIRHEDHSEFGTEDLPRYGLIINPFENTALKFNHGKHFRAPTPNDLFWPADPYTQGNPDLKPETGWHTDAGIEQSFFNDKFFLAATYFHWDVDDKIQWGPDSNGVWTPENLRTYKADGLEASTKIGPFYNLTLKLNYTYLDAEEENKAYTKQDYGWPPLFPPDFQYDWVKRRAAFTPEHLFEGDVTYRTDFGLMFTTTVRYTSDRVWYRTETDGAYPATKTVEYTLDSYWTVDLKVQQRIYDHWILSLQANNLFDKEYETYFGTFTDQTTSVTSVNSYPGAGRFVFFSVTFEY